MTETKIKLALKEAMAYLEVKHRTEETMQLRRLLREAYAELDDDQIACVAPSLAEATGVVAAVKKYSIEEMVEMFPPTEDWHDITTR